MVSRDSSKSKRSAPSKKTARKAAAKPAAKRARKTVSKPAAAKSSGKAAAKPAAKSASAKLATAVEKLEAKFKVMQKERDSLKDELAAATRRIKELEASQTDAVNRIDWVIDSLHNLLEDKA